MTSGSLVQVFTLKVISFRATTILRNRAGCRCVRGLKVQVAVLLVQISHEAVY